MFTKICKSIAACCGLLLALTINHAPAAASVIYNINEQTLAFLVGGLPVPGFTPHTVGSIVLSDTAFARGSVSYSAINLSPGPSANPPFVIVGDTDFSFTISDSLSGHRPSAPVPVPPNPNTDPFINDVLVNLSVTLSGLLSGSITFDSISDNFKMNILNNFATGTIATDDDTLGCHFNQCSFTAVLSTPEPASSLSILILGLVGLGLLRRRNSVK